MTLGHITCIIPPKSKYKRSKETQFGNGNVNSTTQFSPLIPTFWLFLLHLQNSVLLHSWLVITKDIQPVTITVPANSDHLLKVGDYLLKAISQSDNLKQVKLWVSDRHFITNFIIPTC